MKYFLIPFTFILWYLIAYYSLFLCLVGMLYIFSLSWIWLIFGYLFLIAIVFGISNGIPSLFRYLIVKLYGISWFTCLIHSLAGLLGVIWFLYYYVSNPPMLVIGKDEVFFIFGMWRSEEHTSELQSH